MRWLVLIYTLPAEPSRKRAFVWRELKTLGAVYLRDGACLVPDAPATRQAMQAIVDRVRDYAGQATLIESARLDEPTVAAAMGQIQAARAAEYADLVSSCAEVVAHVQRETRHRDLPGPELALLQRDLTKLRRWYGQIRARDYFLGGAAAEAEAALVACEAVCRTSPRTPAAAR